MKTSVIRTNGVRDGTENKVISNYAVEFTKNEFKKHKSEIPIDHPDGSVTLEKLSDDVKNEFAQLQENIDSEARERIVSDNEIKQKLDIEIDTRENEIGNIDIKVTNYEKEAYKLYNSAVTTMERHLTAEADERQAADEALQGDVNTIRSDMVVMSNRFNGKADRVHKHTIEDITDFPQTMTPTDKSVTVDKLSDDAIEFIKTNSGGIFTEKPIYKGEIYPVIANQTFSFDNYHQCDDADGEFQGYAFDMSADVTVYIGDIKYSASKTDEVIVNTSGVFDEAEYYVWLKKYDNGNTEFVLGNYNEYPLGDGYAMLPCGHIYAKANADGEWSYYDVGLGYEYAVDGEEHLTTSTDLNHLRKEISALQSEIALLKEQIKNISASGGVLNATLATEEQIDEMVDNATPDIYVPGGTQIGIASDEAVEAIFNED